MLGHAVETVAAGHAVAIGAPAVQQAHIPAHTLLSTTTFATLWVLEQPHKRIKDKINK